MPAEATGAEVTSESPTTIAHMITDLQTGGAESMLVRVLSASKYRAASCVLSMRGRGTYGEQIEALGVSLENFGMSVGPSFVRAAYNLHRAVRRKRPRLIQGWMYHANIAATLTAGREARPIVVWNIRALQEITREKPLTQAMMRIGAGLSDRPAAIIYNSHASALLHERIGYSSRRTVIIPNGIDIDRFTPSKSARAAIRSALNVAADTLLVGRVGRFHPVKDFPAMLRAAAIVSRELPDAHYVLGGPGVTPDNNELAAQISELGLGTRTHLVGDVKDMAAFMAGLDVNCSSSSWGEAFPNVLVEAMATGVPCVTTDVGDSARVVGDGGLTVPPGDPAALASAVLRLLTLDADSRRAIGDAGRRRVEREFTLRGVAAQYDNLYADLLREAYA